MTMKFCFWALLSVDDLKFLYIPSTIGKIPVINDQTINSLLIDHSLFEFMHPNEIELAKYDLSRFVQAKTLVGSVTRCRLRSLNQIATHSKQSEMYFKNKQFPEHNHMSLSSNSQHSESEWDIVDLVTYTTSNDTLLTFFHSTTFGRNHVMVSHAESGTIALDSLQLVNLLEQRQRQNQCPLDNGNLDQFSFRLFQIVNKETHTRLFGWPLSNPYTDVVQAIGNEISLKEFKSSSNIYTPYANNPCCTRHFYGNTNSPFLEYSSCHFERIMIPYRDIIFECFQVTSENSDYSRRMYPYLAHVYYNNEVERRSPESNSIGSFQRFRLELSTDATERRNNERSGKVCARCCTNSSPEWRRGPDGHKTLCNACGLRYSRSKKQWRNK